MEFEREDIEQEFNRVESAIKRFMKKQYWWIEDINLSRESFQKNKMSSSRLKSYDLDIVIDKKNMDWIQENSEEIDSAEQQFQLLFNTVLGSLTTFDFKSPTHVTVDMTPVIQDSI
jgi:hypothetical protein